MPDDDTYQALEPSLDDDFNNWVQQLESEFNYEPGSIRSSISPPTDPEPPPEEEENPDTDAEPDEVPPEGGEPTLRIGDRDVPVSEVRSLYEFGKSIREGGGGGAPPAPPQQEPVTPPPPPQLTPPAELDMEDPGIKGLWDQFVATHQRTEKLEQQFIESQQLTQQRQAQHDYEIASKSFLTTYNLDQADLDKVRVAAADLLPPLLQTHTSVPEAMAKALYIAALDNPDTRDKVLNITPPTTPKPTSKERKSKLSALNPSGGTASKTPQTPRLQTDHDIRQAFARELEEIMGQSGTLN